LGILSGEAVAQTIEHYASKYNVMGLITRVYANNSCYILSAMFVALDKSVLAKCKSQILLCFYFLIKWPSLCISNSCGSYSQSLLTWVKQCSYYLWHCMLNIILTSQFLFTWAKYHLFECSVVA